jgi:hypothetical protein
LSVRGATVKNPSTAAALDTDVEQTDEASAIVTEPMVEEDVDTCVSSLSTPAALDLGTIRKKNEAERSSHCSDLVSGKDQSITPSSVVLATMPNPREKKFSASNDGAVQSKTVRPKTISEDNVETY